MEIPPMHIPPGMLQGKNVCVTGGTTGIGRAICVAMAKAGANLCVLYLPTDTEREHMDTLTQEVEAIENGAKAIGVAGDVSEEQSLKALVSTCVDQFGEINVMVSNAAMGLETDYPDGESTETYRRVMAVNLDGMYFAVTQASKQMKRQGKGGSIMCTGSIRSLVGGPYHVVYGTTKAAIMGLVQNSASALAPHKITVNALLPGGVLTPLMQQTLPIERQERLAQSIPMGRLGRPEDIAGPAVFLASDLSRFCTGAPFMVDGGQFNNLKD